MPSVFCPLPLNLCFVGCPCTFRWGSKELYYETDQVLICVSGRTEPFTLLLVSSLANSLAPIGKVFFPDLRGHFCLEYYQI